MLAAGPTTCRDRIEDQFRVSFQGASIRHPDWKPTHPGALLREVAIPALDHSKAEIARLLGNGPGLWVRMQADYDLWHAQRDTVVAHIPTLEEA